MALRLGLIGHGRWGQNISRTLRDFPDVVVTVVGRGDSPPSQLSLDGVLIATPSATHAQVALPYIEAGIATFIEKPMTTSLADAERIQRAAEQSGALIFVGHIYLFHPGFLAALALLPSLGAVRCLFSEGMNASVRPDTSVLWDWLPHEVSMALAVLNRDPESVTAWKLAGNRDPTAAVTKFDFDGVPLVSTVSWLSPVRRRRLTIGCMEGDIVFDDGEERKLVLYRSDHEPIMVGYSTDMPLTSEMRAFLEAVRSGISTDKHLRTGISIVRAIAAAEISIALGGQSVAI